MRILMHGKLFWWAGVEITCGHCECVFDLSSNDPLVERSDDATWIAFKCPECERTVRAQKEQMVTEDTLRKPNRKARL